MRHVILRQWTAACFMSVACFLVSAVPAGAAWPTNPAVNIPVSASATRAAYPPGATSDSCGGIITAWTDVGPTIWQINVQRVDAYGQPRWTLDGFPVSPALTSANGAVPIASDGAGGAYVAWAAFMTAATGTDIFVQHVLSAGLVDPAWPAAGLPVCSAPGEQTLPRIVADGAGGVVVAWRDSRGNMDIAPDIYAQRVSPTGATWWTPDGALVVGAPGAQYLDDIAPDGSGGAFAVWGDINGDIAAQRLDGPTGTRQWASGGLPICTVPGSKSAEGVASEAGRLFVAWHDFRGGSAADIYAQSVALNGTILWAANGAPVCVTAPNQVNPRLVPDGLGGAIIGWMELDNSAFFNDLFVQRLDAAGNPLWALNGIPMCVAPGQQSDLQVTSDQRNGAIFTWADFRSGGIFTDADVFAQRVSDAGLMLWGLNGVAVSTALNNQRSPVIVSDGAGGGVIAWDDERGTDLDIYAQQVGATGSVGVRAASRNCAPDICGFAYTDFGDAPENVPAYPSGSFGHFPTCTANTPPGTQEIACGAARSTSPGPTGYVKHVATSSDQTYFGLGCGPSNAQRLAVDTELDGVVHVSGAPPAVIPSEVSTCSPAVTIMAYESAFGGLWFGTDETAGDGIDAGLAAPVVMAACDQAYLPFKAWSCGPASLTATLNILVDWNQDGDWNDVVACGPAGSGGACAPEWAVKNASVVLHPGCNSLISPLIQVGPSTGGAWMRITLTATPVADDFPWAGSAAADAGGAFAGGETEDYPISIVNPAAVGQPVPANQVLLAAVSPNPSRDGASIRYALPRAADIRLSVYDLAGRQVRVLESGPQGAGEHATRWDGRDASGAETSAGVYLVKLHVEGRDLTRAMIRLR